MDRNEARQILQDAQKVSVRTGGHMEVFIFGEGSRDEFEKLIRKAMLKGGVREDVDGTKSWFNMTPVIDLEKTGSAQMTWDASGNRVKHERILVVVAPDGSRTETVVGHSYRNFE